MPDPFGITLKCPKCGAPLTYQHSQDDVHFYRCPTHGRLVLAGGEVSSARRDGCFRRWDVGTPSVRRDVNNEGLVEKHPCEGVKKYLTIVYYGTHVVPRPKRTRRRPTIQPPHVAMPGGKDDGNTALLVARQAHALRSLARGAGVSVAAAAAPGPPQTLVASVSWQHRHAHLVTIVDRRGAIEPPRAGGTGGGGAAVTSLPVPASPLVVPNVPNGVYFVRVVALNADGAIHRPMK